jgi:hypothetical protein
MPVWNYFVNSFYSVQLHQCDYVNILTCLTVSICLLTPVLDIMHNFNFLTHPYPISTSWQGIKRGTNGVHSISAIPVLWLSVNIAILTYRRLAFARRRRYHVFFWLVQSPPSPWASYQTPQVSSSSLKLVLIESGLRLSR